MERGMKISYRFNIHNLHIYKSLFQDLLLKEGYMIKKSVT